MDKLIYHLAQSLREGQISNNLRFYFKRVPEKHDDWVSVASKIALILKEHFIDNGYKDVYPYSVFYVDFVNPVLNLKEAAWLIGVKGQSIEYGNQQVEESSEFLEKMGELEHNLYDQYRFSFNMFHFYTKYWLDPTFGYKKTNMKRVKGFEKEFGRHLDSAFILRIPICDDDE